MTKDEAVQKLSKVARISVAYAEDLYDSFFEKPVVPQYVADWYEEHKNDLNEDIWAYLTSWADTKWDEFKYWMYHTGRNKAITTLANMHQFGYEVDKEPRYTVRIKGLFGKGGYLNRIVKDNEWVVSDNFENDDVRVRNTREEIEKTGFGWVFDCPGVEVKEVDDEND